jgi:hypothetical protein
MKKSVFIAILFSFSVTFAFSQAIVRTQINSQPSAAEIYVDGARIGQTPMEFRFRSGTMYRVELKKDNHHSLSFNYRGGSGNINKRLVALPPPAKPAKKPNKMHAPSYEETRHPPKKEHHKQKHHKPYNKKHEERRPVPHVKRTSILSVTSDIPRAAVRINKKFVGTTPLRIELEKGSYEVFVNLPGHRDYYERINLERDKDIFIRFR